MSEKKIDREPFHTKRLRALSERYPAEDVGTYLKMQRRWIRRVSQMSGLTHTQRVVAIFIGTFMTPSRPFCFASLAYICKCVDVERTTVTRSVAELEKLGFMQVERQKRGGNVYRIAMPF